MTAQDIAAPDTRRRRRRLWITAAAGTLVAAIAVTVGILIHRQDSAPPPLGPHAADVYRLDIPGHTTRSVPPFPTAYVTTAGGTKIGMLLTGPSDTEGPDQATIGLSKGSDRSTTRWHKVAAGDSFTEYGVKVKVLNVWRMPNWGNNAVDVQADPAT